MSEHIRTVNITLEEYESLRRLKREGLPKILEFKKRVELVANELATFLNFLTERGEVKEQIEAFNKLSNTASIKERDDGTYGFHIKDEFVSEPSLPE